MSHRVKEALNRQVKGQGRAQRWIIDDEIRPHFIISSGLLIVFVCRPPNVCLLARRIRGGDRDKGKRVMKAESFT